MLTKDTKSGIIDLSRKHWKEGEKMCFGLT